MSAAFLEIRKFAMQVKVNYAGEREREVRYITI